MTLNLPSKNIFKRKSRRTLSGLVDREIQNLRLSKNLTATDGVRKAELLNRTELVPVAGRFTSGIFKAELGADNVAASFGDGDRIVTLCDGNEAAFFSDGTRRARLVDDTSVLVPVAGRFTSGDFEAELGADNVAASFGDGTRIVTLCDDNEAAFFSDGTQKVRLADANTGLVPFAGRFESGDFEVELAASNVAASFDDGTRIVTMCDDNEAAFFSDRDGRTVKILEEDKAIIIDGAGMSIDADGEISGATLTAGDGSTGSFTTVDGKTVTVTAGIITGIV